MMITIIVASSALPRLPNAPMNTYIITRRKQEKDDDDHNDDEQGDDDDDEDDDKDGDCHDNNHRSIICVTHAAS